MYGIWLPRLRRWACVWDVAYTKGRSAALAAAIGFGTQDEAAAVLREMVGNCDLPGDADVQPMSDHAGFVSIDHLIREMR